MTPLEDDEVSVTLVFLDDALCLCSPFSEDLVDFCRRRSVQFVVVLDHLRQIVDEHISHAGLAVLKLFMNKLKLVVHCFELCRFRKDN